MKFEIDRVGFLDLTALTALLSMRDETQAGYIFHKIDLLAKHTASYRVVCYKNSVNTPCRKHRANRSDLGHKILRCAGNRGSNIID